MSDELSPAVVRRWVKTQLRVRRVAAGLEQKDAAVALKCAPSRISHLESARNLPDYTTLKSLFELYECPDDTAAFWAVVEKVKKAERSKNGRVALASEQDPSSFDVYADLEQGASEKHAANLIALDGLTQIGPYAERLLRFFDPNASDEEIIRRRDLRLSRQSALTREKNPLHLWSVIPEHVLDPKYGIGGPDVLGQQLEHLYDLSRLPNVDIQVLPALTGGHAAVHGPFAVLKFPIQDDLGLVYLDNVVEGIFYEEQRQIAQYDAIMNHLRAAALDQEESRVLFDKLRKEVT
jgi:transcriptional regulator with XRE-family HTH domain